MPDVVTTAASAAAAVSHVGKVRTNNQDSGFAGRHLFVVADGMGGHAGGDVASSIAVNRIAGIDAYDFATPQEAEAALGGALVAANEAIADAVAQHPELTGMGTTCSAVLRVGGALAVAHIGDSRIYLVRSGELSQVTNDHTFVQRLVETGRISPEEAAVHPRRSVLMRVLGDIDQSPEIDTSILGTVAGDRWLLCSDGLSGVVTPETILAVVQRSGTAQDAASALVAEALDHGAPDNVTAIVLEIGAQADVESPSGGLLVGAAAAPLGFGAPDRDRARVGGLRRHPLRTPAEASFEPDEDYLEALIAEDRRRLWRRRITWLVAIALLLVAAALAAVAAWRYTQSQFYVGQAAGRVAVYQGVQAQLGPIELSHVVERSGLDVAKLPDTPICRQLVTATINASSLPDARRIVTNLGSNCGG